MAEELNAAQPQSGTGSNRNLMVALVVIGVTIIALLIAIIFFNLGKNDGGGAAPAQETEQVAAQGQGQAQGAEEIPELEPVEPELKAVIESLWRLDENDQLAVGSLDAKLVVQIYYDFQCGYCTQAATELEPQLQSLIDDGTIRIEYHNLPVLGEGSVLAAQASLAAANQGKFTEFREHLFQQNAKQSPVDLTEAGLADAAREVGVADIDQFTADMTSEDIAAKVQEDLAHATQYLGISGAPAFIIGYSYIPGYIPYDMFTQVVDAELARPTE